MRLLSNDKGVLTKVNVEPFKLERNIQELIEKNTNEIFNLEFISSEISFKSFLKLFFIFLV